jgi:hypothetical protein
MEIMILPTVRYMRVTTIETLGKGVAKQRQSFESPHERPAATKPKTVVSELAEE